jgi:hypothetical protein
MTKEEMLKLIESNSQLMVKLALQNENQSKIINELMEFKKNSYSVELNINNAFRDSIQSVLVDTVRQTLRNNNSYDSSGRLIENIIKKIINENETSLLELTRDAFTVALNEANNLKETLKEEIKEKICKSIAGEIVSSMVDKSMNQFKNSPEFRAKLSLMINDFIKNYELKIIN